MMDNKYVVLMKPIPSKNKLLKKNWQKLNFGFYYDLSDYWKKKNFLPLYKHNLLLKSQ